MTNNQIIIPFGTGTWSWSKGKGKKLRSQADPISVNCELWVWLSINATCPSSQHHAGRHSQPSGHHEDTAILENSLQLCAGVPTENIRRNNKEACLRQLHLSTVPWGVLITDFLSYLTGYPISLHQQVNWLPQKWPSRLVWGCCLSLQCSEAGVQKAQC